MKSPVTVEISGQQYPIRSGLDPAYVKELAAYVDIKMRATSDAAPSTDSLGIAILVALNIADECFRARRKESSSHGDLQQRALKLEQLLDTVLDTEDPARKHKVDT